MPSSICSRCLCRTSWDSDQYLTCDDCRLGKQLGGKVRKSVDLQATLEQFRPLLLQTLQNLLLLQFLRQLFKPLTYVSGHALNVVDSMLITLFQVSYF